MLRRTRRPLPLPPLLPRVLPLVVLVALAVGLAACGGDDAGPTTTVPDRVGGIGLPGGSGVLPEGPPATPNLPGTAKIVSFQMPATVPCTRDVDVEATATYATTGAVSVAFLVDSRQATGTPPVSGTSPVRLACDGSVHTVVLAAVDGDGRATVDSKAVATEPAG